MRFACSIRRVCRRRRSNDITLRDCSFDGVTQPSIVKYTRSVKLSKVRVNDKLVTAL